MPITANDIKLLASERMTDTLDGGGQMAGTPMQDGADNNVFSDIASTVDLARGALQIRAIYAAVLTATTDTLRQGHVLLESLPSNPAVDALLIPAANTVTSLAQLTAALNAAGDNYPFHGATVTTALASSGAAELAVDGTRAVLIPKARTQVTVSGLMSAGNTLPTTTVLLDVGGGTMAPAVLPQRQVKTPIVAGQVAYSVALPPGTVSGSEVVRVIPTQRAVAGGAGGDWYPAVPNGVLSFLSVDRVAGQLSLVFTSATQASYLGTDLVVDFAEGGTTSNLSTGDLAGGGTISAGGYLQINLSAGSTLVGGVLVIGADTLHVLGGTVYSGLSWSTTQGGVVVSGGTPRGNLSASGQLFLPSYAGQTVSSFKGAQSSAGYAVSTVQATLPANIDPATLTVNGETSAGATFTATADGLGVFDTAQVQGSYIAATGALQLAFTSPARLASLAYAGTQRQPLTAYADLWGLNETLFPSDGTVKVIRPGQVGVLRHTATIAAATYTDGAAVNAGRTGLADGRIVGGNGLGIDIGWSLNPDTGVFSISSVAGWVQPVTIQHSIEHVAMVVDTPDEATAVLSRPLERDFPAGSVLSTAVLLGDLQARAGQGFSQQLWDGVWSDTRNGTAPSSQYQQAANPVVVTNLGAVTERWAFVFRTGTTFDLIGETRGLVAGGDVATVFSPINPATGAPYLTIAPAGWGAWSGGHVWRLNTYGAAARVWPARTVKPSAPITGTDQVLLAARGDVNT